jgi:hypothetical protein
MRERESAQLSFADTVVDRLGGRRTQATLDQLDASIDWKALARPIRKLYRNDDGGGGTASRLSFTATPGVRYMLGLTPYANNIGNGQYVINVSYSGSADVTPIPLNAVGDGSTTIQSHGGIPAGGEAQTYSFGTPVNLNSGTSTITLEAGLGNGSIYLFNDAGVQLLGSYGQTGDETLNVTNLLVPGATYHLTVIPELYAAAVTSGTVRINLSTPAVPPTARLRPESDTGVFDDDKVTQQRNGLAFDVPATTGQVIRLYRNGSLLTLAIAVSDGLTVIQDNTGPLADGDYSYTATIADNAGAAQSGHGPAEIVTIDTLAPSISYFFFDLFYNEDHVILFDFSETVFGFDSADLTLQNVSTPGLTPSSADFELFDNGGGTYSHKYDTTINNDRVPSGDYTFGIAAGAATDLAGNESGAFNDTFYFQEGDVDHDRIVGFSDLLILAQRYGTSVVRTEPKPSVFGSRSIGRRGLFETDEAVIV